MNAKKLTGFFKNLQILNFQETNRRPFEFAEQFMMDALKLAQFEKTGSILISLVNLITNFKFSKLEVYHVLRDLYKFAV